MDSRNFEHINIFCSSRGNCKRCRFIQRGRVLHSFGKSYSLMHSLIIENFRQAKSIHWKILVNTGNLFVSTPAYSRSELSNNIVSYKKQNERRPNGSRICFDNCLALSIIWIVMLSIPGPEETQRRPLSSPIV